MVFAGFWESGALEAAGSSGHETRRWSMRLGACGSGRGSKSKDRRGTPQVLVVSTYQSFILVPVF